jgi:hypothetical protein
MTQRQLEREIADNTGESIRTIRRHGFSIISPPDVDFDPEPNDLPAQMVDWDAYDTTVQRAA